MFRVKKSNHSKKIVKQLKKEYKEDLEKSGTVRQDIKSGGIHDIVTSAVNLQRENTLTTHLTLQLQRLSPSTRGHEAEVKHLILVLLTCT